MDDRELTVFDRLGPAVGMGGATVKAVRLGSPAVAYGVEYRPTGPVGHGVQAQQ